METDRFPSKKYFVKPTSCCMISRNLRLMICNVRASQCGNYENSLSRIFDKNFVKSTVLLKKLLKSWFHEIFFSVREHVSFFHTVDTVLKFTVTHLWQKFREFNGFTKEVTKELIWRNFFSMAVNFSFFHTVTL